MAAEKKIYNFVAGQANPKLRVEVATLLKEATAHRLNEEMENGSPFFQYLPTAEGHPRFREELAKFLTEEYGDPISSNSLHLTAGATHGLHVTLSLLVDYGGPVFTEEPIYFFAAGAIPDCGMKTIPISMDAGGINLTELEASIKKQAAAWEGKPKEKLFRGMVYTVPTFHNPTGICYSPECSKALVALARKYDLLLFSDDVYNCLYYTGDLPPKRLCFYDEKSDPDYVGSAISNGSFSKYLVPGIRCGWFEAPERVLQSLNKRSVINGGGPVNQLGSGFMTSALTLGLQQKFLKRIRGIYGNRMSTFGRILKERLPSSCSFDQPQGGFFLWLRLPEGVDNTTIIEKAMSEYNVKVFDGSRSSQLGAYKNYLRLSIAATDDEDVEAGVNALCDCLHKYLPK